MPSCIRNFTQLRILSFSCNVFTFMPQSLWSLTKIWSLNFSHNSLMDHLHPEFGNLIQLITLDMSKNKLSISIPNTSSNIKMLEFLNLSNNAFQGTIPMKIGNLGSLKSLDLSCARKRNFPFPQLSYQHTQILSHTTSLFEQRIISVKKICWEAGALVLYTRESSCQMEKNKLRLLLKSSICDWMSHLYRLIESVKCQGMLNIEIF